MRCISTHKWIWNRLCGRRVMRRHIASIGSSMALHDHLKSKQFAQIMLFKTSGYGYGTLATLLICACSAVGIVFVRCSTTACYSVMMSTFLGMAVGTLYTDALLHLLPVVIPRIFNWLIDWWLIVWYSDLFMYCLNIKWSIDCLTHWCIDWLSDCLVGWLIDCLAC